MKIIAFYLPQFHCIPENDAWWGEGFTEWTNVKKGKKIINEQYQPREPLNDNYYNLLNDNVKQWQVDLAKKYGVYGFCFYHYWFDGHMLLQKPVEQYLNNKNLELPFCLCWANEDWTNAWKGNSNAETLIAQKYGDKKQWIQHFNYLLPYFKDGRYIRVDDKPLVIIYRPEIIPCIKPMLACWRECAIKSGLKGLTVAYQTREYFIQTKGNDEEFDFRIEYQPSYVFQEQAKQSHKYIYPIYRWIRSQIIRRFNYDLLLKKKSKLKKYSYDDLWKKIIDKRPEDSKSLPGAFVDWDNTSRRGKNGRVVVGTTPDKFKKYLFQQIKNAKDNYNTDMLFLFAWNEWAEAGYLEPDKKFEYGYLQALKDALVESREFVN